MTLGNPRSSTSSRVSSGRAIAIAALAPVSLIGGWTLAASLQPAGYSSVSQTISALAAHGARDRVVMTVGLAVLGACYVATSVELRAARRLGRWTLALGGVATIAVSLFPQPTHGSSTGHVTSATVGFVALALWPALAARGGPGWHPLSRRTSVTATVVFVALLCWFGVALGGQHVGLAERFLAGAESCWPLVVVVSNRRRPAAE